ncbi:hypothetical protein SAMN05428946_2322 [Edaphobacillus lindanitolerans]|uniref:Uncharacterized protein n=2 Tax=Edaphobacillus lindanitolerans TaxID=550447 RepID=A0A1U7PRQ4_9BACI|nr:hypothetical protein SAMN05428946_2322 [Edaphobacillus lindanitolerans]
MMNKIGKPEVFFIILIAIIGIGAMFQPALLRYLFLVLAASFAYRVIRPQKGEEKHRWLNMLGVGIGLLGFIFIHPA